MTQIRRGLQRILEGINTQGLEQKIGEKIIQLAGKDSDPRHTTRMDSGCVN